MIKFICLFLSVCFIILFANANIMALNHIKDLEDNDSEEDDMSDVLSESRKSAAYLFVAFIFLVLAIFLSFI